MELTMQTIEAATAPVIPPVVAAPTPAQDLPRDLIGERIIAAGFAPNDFILDLNRALTVPHDWNLPAPWNLRSRLFQFPIEVGEFREGGRRLGLMHPALVDHPFVKHVSQVLGIAIPPGGAPNNCGYSKTGLGTWWHAVDLMSAGQWQEALDTRQFTTTENLARAVGFALSCGRETGPVLTTAEARHVLEVLDIAAPTDPVEILCRLGRPSPVTADDKVERWPVNTGSVQGLEQPWAYIIGLESGWFDHDRSGHIRWTRLGRDRHAAGAGATFIEQASGQGAFAF
jgi:hypothetical protein